MNKVMNRSILTPILIALPSLGLGLSWNMKSTVLTLLVKSITSSDFKLGIISAMVVCIIKSRENNNYSEGFFEKKLKKSNNYIEKNMVK